MGGPGKALAALLAGAVFAGPVVAAPATSLRAPGLKPELTTAEGGLWDLSDKAEAHVQSSAELNKDPKLREYVHGVVCKVAPEYCGELRVYVVDRPVLNATTAPNGYLEVYSGLLLRAQDEDQLAFVLGHEVSHFARNHSMQQNQEMKNTANGMLLLSAGITVVSAGAMYSAARSGAPNAGQTIRSISTAAQSLNDLTYLYGISHLFAFSREQESEADRLGFERARTAGYLAPASVELWNEVVEETHASDFPKTRESEARASIFATHPVTSERIDALKALAGEAPKSDRTEARRAYRQAIRPHLGEWLKDDLRRRDYGQTLRLIDRLKAEGEDAGLLEFYRGETYRHRRAAGDDKLAAEAYRAATAQPDAPPVAWRELGDALKKTGDKPGAGAAYKTYLDRATGADDRWLVEASLKSVQESGGS